MLVIAGGGFAAYLVYQAASRVADTGIIGSGDSVNCPTASEIAALVGSAVAEPLRNSLASTTGCAYVAASEQAGVDVNIVVGPELVADEQLKDFVDEGQAAQVASEPIPVGQRGQAWTYPTKSAAIAVGGGHLVLVEIMSTSGSPIGDQKSAAIAVLQKMIG